MKQMIAGFSMPISPFSRRLNEALKGPKQIAQGIALCLTDEIPVVSYALAAICLIFLSSCHKDTSTAISPGSVIVINEGGYGHGDADISIYDPAKKVVSNNIFHLENGFSLGDVAQSLYLIGDTAYIVMNNSKKVVVADAKQNFKYLYSISLPQASPRFFLPVGGSKAYVTELYNNTIWVVDYRAGTILKTIPVNGKTEQLVSWGGKVYVDEATKPYLGFGTPSPSVHAILEIDPLTDQIINAIVLASDPGSMVLIQNDLFVLAPKQDSPSLHASFYKIDMASFSISKKIDFSPARTPNFVRYSSPANQILFSDSGGIYTMQATDTVIPTSAFIPSDNWNVYGLNADPSTGDIYISDAVDYQQASKVMRYSRTGSPLDRFSAGIITNGFVFK
jgi:DNA-binding beta-propeller fold protein YncE